MRAPQYGDMVYVPDGFGTWVNGIVNETDDLQGTFLIAFREGALKSGEQVMTVHVDGYLEQWAWPADMPWTVDRRVVS